MSIIGYLLNNHTNFISMVNQNPVDIKFNSIFLNNIKVFYSILISGLVTFGIGALYIIFINAVTFGAGVKSCLISGKSLGLILTHGFIEMFMFILSAMITSYILYAFIFKNKKEFINELKNVFKLFVYGNLGVFIAAFIEAFISTKFL